MKCSPLRNKVHTVTQTTPLIPKGFAATCTYTRQICIVHRLKNLPWRCIMWLSFMTVAWVFVVDGLKIHNVTKNPNTKRNINQDKHNISFENGIFIITASHTVYIGASLITKTPNWIAFRLPLDAKLHWQWASHRNICVHQMLRCDEEIRGII